MGNNPITYTDPDGREDENLVGIQAHLAIEKYLVDTFGGRKEVKISNAGKKIGTDGFADYVNDSRREIYEIKPISNQTKIDGKLQLQNYVDHTPNYKKGESLLSKINGVVLKDVPDGLGGTMDLRLITMPSDPSQAGMIYYEATWGGKKTHPQKVPATNQDVASKALAIGSSFAIGYVIYKSLRTAAAAAVCPPLSIPSLLCP